MIPQPAEPTSPVGSVRVAILVVDDNLVNQRVLATLLERAGYRVTVANSGLEALALIEGESFDLILMDVMMPDMDGLRCTRLIRQREKVTGGHVPIVAVTALTGERERCSKAGMDDYLSKPVCAEELARSMARLLGPRSAPAVLVAPLVHAGAEPGWLMALREMGFDEEGIGQLIAIFEKTVPERLARLREASAVSDFDAVRKIAHTLKGSLAVFADAAALGPVNRLLERPESWEDERAIGELETGVSQLRESMKTALVRMGFGGDTTAR